MNNEINNQTSVTYQGNGVQTNYLVPFDYLKKDFIFIQKIDDTEIINLSQGIDFIVVGTMIHFEKAPSYTFRIYRKTTTKPLVSWEDASILKASDLNLQDLQWLHILEEAYSHITYSNFGLTPDEEWDAQLHPIINLPYPVHDSDAVTLGFFKKEFKNNNKKIVNTVADLKKLKGLQIGDMVETLGFKNVGDGQGGLYKIVANRGYTSDVQGRITLKNTSILALDTLAKLKKDKTYSIFSTPNLVLNQMIYCATTYMEHNNLLYYGNFYTAAHGSQSIENGKDGAGRMQIDCSSFIQLVTSGLPFKKTVYAGKSSNEYMYDWGFKWENADTYWFGGKQQRLLANQMLYFCDVHGYSFKPNSTFSNIQPGDLLFIANSKEDTYKNIGHVCMFLYPGYEENMIWVIECTNNKNQKNEYPIEINKYAIDSDFVKNCISAARLPLSTACVSTCSDVLVSNHFNNSTYKNEKPTTLLSGQLKQEVKRGQFYTFIAKITQDKTQPKQYFALKLNNNYYVHKRESSNIYTFNIFIDNTVGQGVKTFEIVPYVNGTPGNVLQVNTQVEWVQVYHGIYPKSGDTPPALDVNKEVFEPTTSIQLYKKLSDVWRSLPNNSLYSFILRGHVMSDGAINAAEFSRIGVITLFKGVGGYGTLEFKAYSGLNVNQGYIYIPLVNWNGDPNALKTINKYYIPLTKI